MADINEEQKKQAAESAKLSRRQRKKQEIASGQRVIKTAPKDQKPGLFTRAKTFFYEAKAELLKVTWPTRPDTIKSTGVLLVLVGIAALYLGVVDAILGKVVKLILS